MHNIIAQGVGFTNKVAALEQGDDALPRPVPEIYKNLNFKVSPEFHRTFKSWAAGHDKSMTAVLIEAFELYQASC